MHLQSLGAALGRGDREDARRLGEAQGGEEAVLLCGDLSALRDRPDRQTRPVQPLEGSTDLRPPLGGSALADPHQQQRQPAQQHVRADPLLHPVVDGPQIQGVFERAEGVFDLDELPVAHGEIFGGEAIIRGAHQVRAVEPRLGPHLVRVDLQPAVLVRAEVEPIGGVGQERAARSGVGRAGTVREGGQLLAQACESASRCLRSRSASCGLRTRMERRREGPVPTMISFISRLSRTGW